VAPEAEQVERTRRKTLVTGPIRGFCALQAANSASSPFAQYSLRPIYEVPAKSALSVFWPFRPRSPGANRVEQAAKGFPCADGVPAVRFAPHPTQEGSRP
jgi:hypothetical protein